MIQHFRQKFSNFSLVEAVIEAVIEAAVGEADPGNILEADFFRKMVFEARPVLENFVAVLADLLRRVRVPAKLERSKDGR